MSDRTNGQVDVLCVDDNPDVAEALRIKLSRTTGFRWVGWLPHAGEMPQRVEASRPALILLDVDMPGRDPFDAMAEIAERWPESRTLVFSGHVRRELFERAVESGAWGYVSKNDGEEALIAAMRRVAAGEFAVSDEVRALDA